MPKIYKRNCNNCREYYEGRGKYCCSYKCAAQIFSPLGGKKRRGEKHPRWKDGKCATGEGYIQVLKPNHPHNNRGYVLEHRLVAERILDRYLKPKEVIHHINTNIADNKPENLYYFRHHNAHSRFEWFCKRHKLNKSKLLTSNLQLYANKNF